MCAGCAGALLINGNCINIRKETGQMDGWTDARLLLYAFHYTVDAADIIK